MRLKKFIGFEKKLGKFSKGGGRFAESYKVAGSVALTREDALFEVNSFIINVIHEKNPF